MTNKRIEISPHPSTNWQCGGFLIRGWLLMRGYYPRSHITLNFAMWSHPQSQINLRSRSQAMCQTINDTTQHLLGLLPPNKAGLVNCRAKSAQGNIARSLLRGQVWNENRHIFTSTIPLATKLGKLVLKIGNIDVVNS